MRKWWSFFCTTKSNTTNHPVQASNTWDLVKEKAVEGKEAAAERVTSLKEAAVEKVNSRILMFSIFVKMAT